MKGSADAYGRKGHKVKADVDGYPQPGVHRHSVKMQIGATTY
jgi:hypothetical protein